jgi:hypothetical protein
VIGSFFAVGDVVRVLHRGKLLRGRWIFLGYRDRGATIEVRREGKASGRIFEVRDTNIFDFDAEIVR